MVSGELGSILTSVRGTGFARVDAGAMRALLSPSALQDWALFAASWADLGVDGYMADGGRYRRRRFSAFSLSANAIARKPHQPHYQSRDYNVLNGGIERWFLPITEEAAATTTLQSVLRSCFEVFNELTPAAVRPNSWHTECHQFRIEARSDAHGQPTPEGLHRDGVDWVLVMLVSRENIAEGVTSIHDEQKRLIGRFTLANSLDSAFVDDTRVYHGVTPVVPMDASRPAHRDVLVVTLRRE